MRLDRLFMAVLCLSGCAAPAPRPSAAQAKPRASLTKLLACNDSVIGGGALRRIQHLEYDLRIKEPSFEVDGTYVTDRIGTARIDVFADGERVFSEGWDGSAGWQLQKGKSDPEPTSAEGADALRHGVEQPGHLWTLRDMAEHGHSIREDDRDEATAGERVVHLTLSDGFESWFWVDIGTCLITRKRDFRAFHPDVDPTRTWVENRFADYRKTDDVTRAWSTYSVNLATGDTIGFTRLVSVRTTFGASPDTARPDTTGVLGAP